MILAMGSSLELRAVGVPQDGKHLTCAERAVAPADRDS
jgi:hypothetical protein